MRSIDISVVIPTRNRPALLARAIGSVLEAGITNSNIVVVDDNSDDDVASYIRQKYGCVNVIELKAQGGPGKARNLGLAAVTSPFALMLDDDDTLQRDALARLQHCVSQIEDTNKYPVFQFAQNNGFSASPFLMATLLDYVTDRILGDFAPLIQVKVFRKHGLLYPDTVIGGESRLWFRIARDIGIPTWACPIVTVHNDAPVRLCSVNSQLQRPREYALSMEQLLNEFGMDLQTLSVEYYRRKRFGAAMYRLLARNRREALGHAATLFREGEILMSGGLAACGLIPHSVLCRVFKKYRTTAA